MEKFVIEFPRFSEVGVSTSFDLRNDDECQQLLDIISTSFYRFINWQGKLNKSMPSMPTECVCCTKTKCKCLQKYTRQLLGWLESRAITEDGGKYSTHGREERKNRKISSSSSNSSSS